MMGILYTVVMMLTLLSSGVVQATEKKAPAKAVEQLVERFGRHYEPIEVDVKPSIRAYELPLSRERIANYRYVAEKFQLGMRAEEALLRNGIVARRWGTHEDFVKAYADLRKMEVPVYVTSESVLHLYHIHFDETLKYLEQAKFISNMILLSHEIIEHLLEERNIAKGEDIEAGLDKAIAFFAVGREMLTDYSDEVTALKEYRDKLARKGYDFMLLVEHQPEALRNAILNTPEAKSTEGQRSMRMFGSALDEKGRDAALADILEMLDAIIERKSRESKALDLPMHVRGWVDHDKNWARKHDGFEISRIFDYREDFSQYVPRGHYTRGFDLRRYFMAMMWFGRMTFLINGGGPHGPSGEYLVSHREAKRQTIAACYIVRAIRDIDVGDESAEKIWDRIYGVTSFFAGLADDLTYTEYDLAFREALGDAYEPEMLGYENDYLKVKTELAKLRKPDIYSGTGRSEAMAPAVLRGEPTPEELDKALGKTQGFRFMGQRFVPDSYVMGRLVLPTVGDYDGSRPAEQVFTCGASEPDCNPLAKSKRIFPRGLDVMALLGSNRAKTHLQATGDIAYKGYDQAFSQLVGEFSEIRDPEGWNVNLYWSWLYCLKGLLKEYPVGYQPYMTTPAWQDKQLTSALGSWSQLRHDVLLYAKQSATLLVSGVSPRPMDLPGYVEPVPEFYTRLLALLRLTKGVLLEMGVLDEEIKKRLERTGGLLSRLLDISMKELANIRLLPGDERWIKHFDKWLGDACCGFETEAMKTTLIADVHTDTNTDKTLQEGTGYIGLILVANRLPSGSIGLAAGPVFTYYEFKHPIEDRLTDEKWRAMLGSSSDDLADRKPEFTKSYFVEE